MVPGLWQGWEEERSGKELRWLASANANTCGVKAGEICRQSTATVLAVGFLSGEIC